MKTAIRFDAKEEETVRRSSVKILTLTKKMRTRGFDITGFGSTSNPVFSGFFEDKKGVLPGSLFVIEIKKVEDEKLKELELFIEEQKGKLIDTKVHFGPDQDLRHRILIDSTGLSET